MPCLLTLHHKTGKIPSFLVDLSNKIKKRRKNGKNEKVFKHVIFAVCSFPDSRKSAKNHNHYHTKKDSKDLV